MRQILKANASSTGPGFLKSLKDRGLWKLPRDIWACGLKFVLIENTLPEIFTYPHLQWHGYDTRYSGITRYLNSAPVSETNRRMACI